MTINDLRQRAQKTIDHFTDTLKTIRTGRANPSLVENLMVDAYGSKMPLQQLAAISAPEPRLLTITVWDQSLTEAVIKAIKNSELGVNPTSEANLIRINIPPMTQERRQEFVKIVGKYEEETKVSLRNIRRECMDDLKKREKEEKLPENQVKTEEETIDKETRKFTDQVEELSNKKQKELMEL